MAGLALGDVWRGARNRLLADPGFRAWAAAFPLTRGVARRRAEGLFDLVAGFVYSQVLSACVRLRLLDRLAAGPETTSDLASALALPPDGAARLLAAAAALGLVDRAGADRWALGPQGAVLRAQPGLGEMIEHHQHLYADLADSVDLLRREGGGQGDLAAYWPYATARTPRIAPEPAVKAYSALMAATQPAVADELLAAYPVRRHARLLDVGGGEGVFLAAAAARAPRLALQLFDLPAVAARARRALAEHGLAARAEVFEGDFLADPLPRGADLITLIRILHDHDDDGAAALLRAAHAALPKKGALLIAEPMTDDTGGGRFADAYFPLYLLAMGRGRPRSPRQIYAMLAAAGFRSGRLLHTRTPFLLRVILARP